MSVEIEKLGGAIPGAFLLTWTEGVRGPVCGGLQVYHQVTCSVPIVLRPGYDFETLRAEFGRGRPFNPRDFAEWLIREDYVK